MEGILNLPFRLVLFFFNGFSVISIEIPVGNDSVTYFIPSLNSFFIFSLFF